MFRSLCHLLLLNWTNEIFKVYDAISIAFLHVKLWFYLNVNSSSATVFPTAKGQTITNIQITLILKTFNFPSTLTWRLRKIQCYLIEIASIPFLSFPCFFGQQPSLCFLPKQTPINILQNIFIFAKKNGLLKHQKML